VPAPCATLVTGDDMTDVGPSSHVDPAELARVSQSYMDESQTLFAALRILRASAPIGATDFGSVDQAEELAGTHENVLGLAGSMFERFIAVLDRPGGRRRSTAAHGVRIPAGRRRRGTPLP
jgi:hypothetical protein